MWILVTLPTVKEKSPEVYNWVLFLSWSLRNRKNITGFRVSDYCLFCLWVNTWSIFPTENSALFPAVYKEVHRSITGWNRITENILLFLEEGPSKSEVNRWSILIILIKNFKMLMVAELCIWLVLISFYRTWANMVFELMTWMKELRHVNWRGERMLDTVRKDVFFRKGFPGSAMEKNPPANEGDAGDSGAICGSGRSHGGGNGNPLQYSCLENPMDRGT